MDQFVDEIHAFWQALPGSFPIGQLILPTVPTTHLLSEADEKLLQETVALIEDLISKHDVIFLALDSREARWLPTVIGSKYGKVAFPPFIISLHPISDGIQCSPWFRQFRGNKTRIEKRRGGRHSL